MLVPLQQTVSATHRLWIASARGDWQVTPNDVALSLFSNVNNLTNVGVGGLSLAESGYSGLVNEYDLRLTNTQTLNANAHHQTRIGYTWKRTEQTPLSPAPPVQVPGYFTCDGSTGGHLNNRERDLDDEHYHQAAHLSGRHRSAAALHLTQSAVSRRVQKP